MKIQIGVCGHAWPIRLASGWVPWDLGMSDFLICLSFVFSLCPREHTLLHSWEGDGTVPLLDGLGQYPKQGPQEDRVSHHCL